MQFILTYLATPAMLTDPKPTTGTSSESAPPYSDRSVPKSSIRTFQPTRVRQVKDCCRPSLIATVRTICSVVHDHQPQQKSWTSLAFHSHSYPSRKETYSICPEASNAEYKKMAAKLVNRPSNPNHAEFSSQSTLDNRMSCAEFTLPPKTSGPPPHWHIMVSFGRGFSTEVENIPIFESTDVRHSTTRRSWLQKA